MTHTQKPKFQTTTEVYEGHTSKKKSFLFSKKCENIHLGLHLIEIYAYFIPWSKEKT